MRAHLPVNSYEAKGGYICKLIVLRKPRVCLTNPKLEAQLAKGTLIQCCLSPFRRVHNGIGHGKVFASFRNRSLTP